MLQTIDHIVAANLILVVTCTLVSFAVSGLTVKGMIDRNPSRRTIQLILLAGVLYWAASFALATVLDWHTLAAMKAWHIPHLPIFGDLS